MAISQNGWSVLFSAPADTSKWITGRVRPGDSAVVLDYVLERFNAEVEKITVPWSWGWNVRAIRGQTSGYSNHASGTARDVNSPKHPLGRAGTFSAKQVEAIHKIITACEGVVRWGGDYNGRKDEMHFEINANSQATAALAARIKAGTVAKAAPPWKPDTTLKVSLSRVKAQFLIAAGLSKGKVSRNNGVAQIQAALNTRYQAGLTVDGYCGKATLNEWGVHEAKVGPKQAGGRPRIPDRKSLTALMGAEKVTG